MTQKEKAEAYDRAIERAKKWYNAPNIDKVPIYGNRLIERIFPEINESEDGSDEDIIKTAILNYLKKMWGNCQVNVCGIHVEDAINWLEKQGKKSSWKPSKEEMDVLYSLSYTTNEYDEHKEDVITHLYQDLKREFFNDSSYENMFSLDNKEDDVRRRSTIQVLEYVRSLDAYNQYGKADIDKNIDWLEKQGEQAPSQTNERAWLYLVSDVLTWKDGIGQYLDDPRVRELAKKLCSEYTQKLYSPSNTLKDEQKSVDKIKPEFKVGDWIMFYGGNPFKILKIEADINGVLEYLLLDQNGHDFYFNKTHVDKNTRLWTIQDAKDGDVLACKEDILLFKSYSVQRRISLYCWYNGRTNNLYSKEVTDISLSKRNKICPATKEQRDLLFQKMKESGYEWDADKKELKKLVPNRFNPKTLKPFDKVLVRDDETCIWKADFYSHKGENRTHPFKCVSLIYKCCIPYNEDTKHLVGTKDEAPEYYRYWED